MIRKHSRVGIQREDEKWVHGRVISVYADSQYDVNYIGVDGQMQCGKMIKEEYLRKMDKTAYGIIFDRLEPIVTALGGEDYVKLKAKGFMDLHVNKLSGDKRTVRISLAHYYEQNGDMVPDPDMEIRLYPDRWQAEALTFQNCMVYQEVYTIEDGKTMVRPKLKSQLNTFLKFWLSNIKRQGFLKGVEV